MQDLTPPQCGQLPQKVSKKATGVHSVKNRPRTGWDAAFKKMHEAGADRLLIDDRLDLDLKGWEW